MDLLRVHAGNIVDSQDNPLQLRGTCAGGWMNMENFINGHPGAEHTLRATMAEILGPARAEFFFERLLDYFLSEDDIAWMKQCGATVVRLPFNYRHLERDSNPFHYLEMGFRRLDRAIEWCAKHGLYAILDLHAVQGWQNTDWHSDNGNRHSLFWTTPHFQDRFVALWLRIAERYAGNPAVAGYNVINEPVTNVVNGRISDVYSPDWAILNRVYFHVASAIRFADPGHIIFLEGDYYSQRFAGLEPPFDPNLVYSSHNYSSAGFGPGAYPGTFRGQYYDRSTQQATFEKSEGVQFMRKYNVPLWVGEFGSVYNGPAAEIPDRLQAMDDQLSAFEACGAHWTTWTYKDVGIMGWTMLDPESEYMQRIAPILHAKGQLDTDAWLGWMPPSPARQMVRSLARFAEQTIQDPGIQPVANDRYLSQAALDNYMGLLLQPAYARVFKDLSETEIDRILQSFALKNCKPNAGLIAVLKKHLR
jgi:endoglucanase